MSSDATSSDVSTDSMSSSSSSSSTSSEEIRAKKPKLVKKKKTTKKQLRFENEGLNSSKTSGNIGEEEVQVAEMEKNKSPGKIRRQKLARTAAKRGNLLSMLRCNISSYRLRG